MWLEQTEWDRQQEEEEIRELFNTTMDIFSRPFEKEKKKTDEER